MKCRKCGGRTSRRRAGVFSCSHCGVQPGVEHMDRAGIPQFLFEENDASSPTNPETQE